MNKRVIGVFIDWFGVGFQKEFVTGIDNEAVRQGVSVLYFPGRAINMADPGQVFRNRIYDLVKNTPLSGLIIFVPVVDTLKPEEIEEFIALYSHIPVVTAEFRTKTNKAVVIDYREAFRKLIRHQIIVHNRQKTVFIHGPLERTTSIDRYNDYVTILKECGISVDPALLVEGNFLKESGIAAVTTLIDERGLKPGKDFNALVASNDNMAVGAVYELEKRNVSIPGQVAVTGLDNIKEGKLLFQPLSTVTFPVYQLGRECMRSVLDYDRAPVLKTVYSRVILRKSCGCHAFYSSPGIVQKERGSKDLYLKKLMEDKPVLIQEIAESFFSPYVEEFTAAMAEEFLESFIRIVNDEDFVKGVFFKKLDYWLHRIKNAGGEIDEIYNGIALLQTHLYKFMPQESFFFKIRDLLLNAEKIVSRFLMETEYLDQSLNNMYKVRLSWLADGMNNVIDIKNKFIIMANDLPNLNIPFYALFFYEDPDQPEEGFKLITSNHDAFNVSDDVSVPGWSFFNLKSRVFANLRSIIEVLQSSVKQTSFAVTSIGTRAGIYGFMIFSYSKSAWEAVDYVPMQISFSLMTSMLYNKSLDTNQKLKTAQKRLYESSHISGMAQIAANVMHNIGNILSSVNISAGYIADTLKSSRLAGLEKAVKLLVRNEDDLVNFFSTNKASKVLPQYLNIIVEKLIRENKRITDEANGLQKKIHKINEFIMEQEHLVSGIRYMEILNLIHVFDDLLLVAEDSLKDTRLDICHFPDEKYFIKGQKNKLLYTFMTLLEKGIEAMAGERKKVVTIQLEKKNKLIIIKMSHTGRGFSEEELEKLFVYSTDTGTGVKHSKYNFHSCFNFLKEMNAAISVHSEGGNTGVFYSITFPEVPPVEESASR